MKFMLPFFGRHSFAFSFIPNTFSLCGIVASYEAEVKYCYFIWNLSMSEEW
jgi:hypothetical protein